MAELEALKRKQLETLGGHWKEEYGDGRDSTGGTIQQLESQALGWQTGDLTADHARSIDAYLSKPYGTKVEGRSQVVTSDVSGRD